MTSGALIKLQNALGLPQTGGSVFTDEMGVAMEAYLATKGSPTTKPAIVMALVPFKTISATSASLNLSDQNLNDAADAYLVYKGLPADGAVYSTSTSKSWFAKNWPWLAGGGVLLAGAVAGTVWYFRKEDKQSNGLGCGCGLGRR